MEKFNYLSDNNIKEDLFIHVPREFFRRKYYRENLSLDAMVLYGLLKDMLRYSIVNGVKDKAGKYYAIATVETLAKLMSLSKNTIRKIIKELQATNLIIIEAMEGYNPNRRIYIAAVGI